MRCESFALENDGLFRETPKKAKAANGLRAQSGPIPDSLKSKQPLQVQRIARVRGLIDVAKQPSEDLRTGPQLPLPEKLPSPPPLPNSERSMIIAPKIDAFRA